MNTEHLLENIKRFSKARGESSSRACINAGLGKNFSSTMKRGISPSVEKVQQLAAYLGVTTSELLGEETPAGEKPAPGIGDGLDDYDRELIRRLPDLSLDQKKLLLAQLKALEETRE